MNSFRVRIFWCCAAAILANGCNPIDPCAGVTCDPNEVCVNGDCVECLTNADCEANEVCVDARCETVVTCDGDDDCAAGETCFNGMCAANCIANDSCACDGDADCNDQDACTTDTCGDQTCFNFPISCNTAADCPDGCNVSCGALSFCSNSVDPCANCEPNEFCIFGACVECMNDADCATGEICGNGNCVECVSDGHCDGGVCDEAANTCVECVGNDDCDDFNNNPCVQAVCDGQNCSYFRFTCFTISCPANCQCVESDFGYNCLAPDEID